MKTRTVGKCYPKENGQWYWICEFWVEGYDEKITVNSTEGETPLLYDTKPLALEGLKECVKVIQKELIKRVGVKNLISTQNNGKYYLN